MLFESWLIAFENPSINEIAIRRSHFRRKKSVRLIPIIHSVYVKKRWGRHSTARMCFGTLLQGIREMQKAG